jgi:hypothetical protein
MRRRVVALRELDEEDAEETIEEILRYLYKG